MMQEVFKAQVQPGKIEIINTHSTPSLTIFFDFSDSDFFGSSRERRIQVLGLTVQTTIF